MDHNRVWNTIIFFSLSAVLVLLTGPAATAAPNDAQKCDAYKLNQAARYASCRLKADGKAVKKSTTADYSRCNLKVLDGYAKAEAKFSCEVTGDASMVQGFLSTATNSLDTLAEGEVLFCDESTGWDGGTCVSLLSCGVNTVVDEDGECGPNLAVICDAGTSEDPSGVCISTLSCGVNTVDEDGECEPNLAVICDTGTSEDPSGVCVPTQVGPDFCGSNTTWDGLASECTGGLSCTLPLTAGCADGDTDCTCHDFGGYDLILADLSGADIGRARASGVQLHSATLTNLQADDAVLVKADLTSALAQNASLQGASLAGAILVNADLTGAQLNGATLRGAWIDGADLTNADLTDTDLTDLDAGKAILANVTWGNTTCPDGTLSNDHGSNNCCNNFVDSWPDTCS
jgi:hypothetical protein